MCERAMLQNYQADRCDRGGTSAFRFKAQIALMLLVFLLQWQKKQNWVRFSALSAHYITSCHRTSEKGSSSCHSFYSFVEILSGKQWFSLSVVLLLYRLPSRYLWLRRWLLRTTTPWVSLPFSSRRSLRKEPVRVAKSAALILISLQLQLIHDEELKCWWWWWWWWWLILGYLLCLVTVC